MVAFVDDTLPRNGHFAAHLQLICAKPCQRGSHQHVLLPAYRWRRGVWHGQHGSCQTIILGAFVAQGRETEMSTYATIHKRLLGTHVLPCINQLYACF